MIDQEGLPKPRSPVVDYNCCKQNSQDFFLINGEIFPHFSSLYDLVTTFDAPCANSEFCCP